VEKCEEADKNKEIASSSNQKCKVYLRFNIIIVVLRHEPKLFSESAIRCYCEADFCTSKEVTCQGTNPYCVKIDVDNGKCLQNRHFDIYIRQSHKISQNI